MLLHTDHTSMAPSITQEESHLYIMTVDMCKMILGQHSHVRVKHAQLYLYSFILHTINKTQQMCCAVCTSWWPEASMVELDLFACVRRPAHF